MNDSEKLMLIISKLDKLITMQTKQERNIQTLAGNVGWALNKLKNG